MALIDLEKKVQIVLEKRAVPASVRARVNLAMDISGSMQGLYNNGTVQTTVDRILAVAARFDDDGSLDMYTYDTRVTQCKSALKEDFNGYVQKHILGNSKVSKWGGTAFAPVLEAIIKNLFSSSGGFFSAKKVDNSPAYVIIVTDGDDQGERETERLISEAQTKNVYFQFVGIGNGTSFSFCKRMADKYGNVGFTHVANIERTSDEQLYESLLNEEFTTWIKNVKVAA